MSNGVRVKDGVKARDRVRVLFRSSKRNSNLPHSVHCVIQTLST